MNQAGARSTRRKSILLFSDGTGNSSGKLFKTNVWRTYEALDLGPARSAGDDVQIAYYDNGVGTSGFKPFALAGGLFGFGLKRNILSIYRFVCRNYSDGDRIYAFGFSRGAFTIRMAVALLCAKGVIRYENERELVHLSRAALRDFTGNTNPDVFPLLAIFFRALRDTWTRIKRFGRPPLPTKTPYSPEIEFIGVWDTVSAYGGPIAEITRGIDNWVWPLSMTDYRLSPKVKAARHALALDDERDSFHPLLWDEFNESEQERNATNPADKAKYRLRMQQVWFAGMHSDVGGGYPDESLSYVSLRWMMDSAKVAGVRFLDSFYDRIAEVSNSFGPVHDSRKGLASYYRYQPRKITGYLHPESQPDDVTARRKSRVVRETLSLRDPTIGKPNYRPQGFLLSCKVHESVVARIATGTDQYAPVSLPDSFEIAPPAQAPPALQPAAYPPETWANIARSNIIDPRTGRSPRGDLQEAIWDDVFRRRVAYFATVLSTLVLVALPWWGKAIHTDDRWVWGRVTAGIGRLLPDFAGPWILALRDTPWLFGVLVLAILVSRGFGERYRRRIKDRARALWCDAMQGADLQPAGETRLRRWRNSFAYQSTLQSLKWKYLPNAVGLIFVLALLYATLVVVTQVKLAVDERSACALKGQKRTTSGPFRTNEICQSTGRRVVADQQYLVEFRVVEEWADGDVRANPLGVKAGRLGPLGWLGAPLRRVVDAPYLEPLYQIRAHKPGKRFASIYIGRLTMTRVEGGEIYRGGFVAPMDGNLSFFVNDAVAFWDFAYFYKKGRGQNAGAALVTITPRPAQVPQTSKPRRVR